MVVFFRNFTDNNVSVLAVPAPHGFIIMISDNTSQGQGHLEFIGKVRSQIHIFMADFKRTGVVVGMIKQKGHELLCSDTASSAVVDMLPHPLKGDSGFLCDSKTFAANNGIRIKKEIGNQFYGLCLTDFGHMKRDLADDTQYFFHTVIPFFCATDIDTGIGKISPHV